MEWSIQEVARTAGTTSRTLRHYGDVGLLPASRIGGNGYRYYDEDALARLQRILLLRELGLGIPAIVEVMEGQRDNAQALVAHRQWLAQERERLDRQIASVELTIRKLEEGEQLMAEEMFDGFDHVQYKDEVEERWGKEAYASSDRWWRSKSKAERQGYLEQHKQIAADYTTARAAGESAESDGVQAIARRHYDWIVLGWQGKRPTAEQFVGLGEMYVADDRFGANYGGHEGAEFVRDAFVHYAEHSL
jgi:DNA-binding transcriptional MerR regulator